MKELSPEQLMEAAEWWYVRLGLQVWQIELSRARCFDQEGNLGRVRWALGKRTATISLLERGDLDSANRDMDDEVVLVHELLHIVTAAWYDRTSDDLSDFENEICIEQPIELLSELLVKMRRRFTAWAFSWEIDCVPNIDLFEGIEQEAD